VANPPDCSHYLSYEVALRPQDGDPLEVGRQCVGFYLGNHHRQYATGRVLPFLLGDLKLSERGAAFCYRIVAEQKDEKVASFNRFPYTQIVVFTGIKRSALKKYGVALIAQGGTESLSVLTLG
jgi:hypothetical protein